MSQVLAFIVGVGAATLIGFAFAAAMATGGGQVLTASLGAFLIAAGVVEALGVASRSR